MATLTERLAILITADAAGAVREIGNVGAAADKHLGSATAGSERMASTFVKSGAIMVGAAATMGAGLMSAAGAASDLEESMSKATVVFGKDFKEVEKWADGAAKAMGMSKQAALEASGTLGNFLISMGNPKDAAKDMSMAMVQLAADLASFNNANIDEVMLAIRSGLSGEAEPLRKFGVSLSAARIEAEGAAVGINKVYAEMTSAEKTTLSYQVIMKDTALAQGDFARTSDGLANSQRIFNAQMDDLKAKIGAGVIPFLTTATGAASKFVGALSEIDQVSGGAVGKFATIGTIGAGVSGSLLLAAGGLIKFKTHLADVAEQAPKAAAAARGIAGIGAFAGGILAGATALQSLGIGAADLAEKLGDLEGAADRVLIRKMKEASQSIQGLGTDKAKADLLAFTGVLETAGAGGAQRLITALRAAGVDVTAFEGVMEKHNAVQKRGKADADAAADAIEGEGDAAADAAPKFEDLIDAVNDLIGAELGIEAANFRVEDSLADLEEAYAEGTTDEQARKFLDLKESVAGAAGAVGEKAAADAASLGPAEAARAKTAAQTEYLQGLASTLAPDHPLRQFIEQYIGRLNAIPKEVPTTVQLDSAEAEAKVQRLFGQLRTLSSQTGTAAADERFLYEVYGPDPRALGGPVQAGVAYKVGELGEEIFVPEQDGKIIPNDEIVAAPAGIMSSDTWTASKVKAYEAAAVAAQAFNETATNGASAAERERLNQAWQSAYSAYQNPAAFSVPDLRNGADPYGVSSIAANKAAYVNHTYNIKFDVSGMDEAEIGRKVVESIRAFEQRSGATWRNN